MSATARAASPSGEKTRGAAAAEGGLARGGDPGVEPMTRRLFLGLTGAALAVGFAGCGGGGGGSAPADDPPEPPPPLPKIRDDQVYLWVEAEHFQDYGGWTLETQFLEQMGSAYLMAKGLAGPVSPAKTTVRVPSAGTYRVWARCKNWEPVWSPGRFRVSVGEILLPADLGIGPGGGWAWEEAGSAELSAGDVELSLQDLTGWYGRCDALLLTTDAEFLPPDHQDNVTWLRGQLSGIPREPVDGGAYDLVVAGGGIAGTIAAVTAARHGLTVALLQNRPVLGGNASREVGVYVQSAGSVNPNARESGLVEELAREASRQSHSLGWQEALLAACRAEGRLTLLLDTAVTEVVLRDPATIDAVVATHAITGERSLLRGGLFADCTGDATLGAAAGADFRMGREAKAEYGEWWAPSRADSFTLGSTLLYWRDKAATPQPYAAPPWARYFDDEALRDREVNGPGPFWWIEWGGRRDTIRDAEEIRDELLRIVHGLWDYIKNRSPLSAAMVNERLRLVKTVAGKRESRRLLGDHVLTEGDLKRPPRFPDAVAYGGWGIDLHAPGGIDDAGPPGTWDPCGVYSIPFRCLYSRNVTNLLMGGRNLSASHVALGSTRVMGTCGTLGQAVGTAAALCAAHGVTPRELAARHIGELQQTLLRDDAYIIGLRNEDPADLARVAAASASSIWKEAGSDPARYAPANVTNGVARPVGSASNLWVSDPAEPLPQWIQLEWSQPVTVGSVQLSFDVNLSLSRVTKRVEPETVRDYEVQVRVGGSWLPVATVQGNYQRLRRHRFDPVVTDGLRVLVSATNGATSARIFEVRAYP